MITPDTLKIIRKKFFFFFSAIIRMSVKNEHFKRKFYKVTFTKTKM